MPCVSCIHCFSPKKFSVYCWCLTNVLIAFPSLWNICKASENVKPSMFTSMFASLLSSSSMHFNIYLEEKECVVSVFFRCFFFLVRCGDIHRHAVILSVSKMLFECNVKAIIKNCIRLLLLSEQCQHSVLKLYLHCIEYSTWTCRHT